MNRDCEVIGVAEGPMGKEVLLEIAPGALDVVQLPGVFRYSLGGQPRFGLQSGASTVAATTTGAGGADPVTLGR